MRSLGDVLYNFHWIVPGEAARSAQAYAGFLGPFLTKRGIRGMINLRGNHPKVGWWRYEDRVSRARGVTHLDVMLNSRNLPQRGMLVALFNAFDKAPRPFVVKCSGGQDRTSFAAALYLIHRDGWRERARAEAQFARFPYLHFPKEHQRWLKAFLAFAEQDSKGRPIAQWVADSYEPEKLRDWLNANGFAGTFAGIFALPPGARAQW
jgi:protein tyrosine/serine phosphatase